MSAKPFIFDTEFDEAGEVVRPSAWKPVKHSFQQAEVDALVAQAKLEARQQALAEVENLRAMALSTVAQSVAQSMAMLQSVAEQHRQFSAELAMAAGRSIAGVALERFPHAQIRSTLESLAQEIEATPRLVIRTGSLDEATQLMISQAAADAGFTGTVAFRNEPGMPAAAFQLEWADGRADFDPESSARRVEEALRVALAGEAGHSEMTAPDRSAY